MGQSPDGTTYSDTPSDYILVQGNADLVDGWVSPRIWTTQKTKTCSAGDLIMSVRAPAGTMGKTAYNAVIGRGVASIKGNEFVFQQLSKMDNDGFWKKDSSGSTFESLNSDSIKNAEISLPREVEQVKIGSLFKNLDHLITLHQRKLIFLKSHRFLMSVLFCYSWEQRKLKDESNYIVAGGDVDKSKLKESGSYPVIANALTNDGIVGYYASEFRIDAPAVTVTGRGEVGYAVARKCNFTPIVRLLSIKTSHDVDFLANNINLKGFVVESTGVPQLTVPKLEDLLLYFPKQISEEIHIGNMFVKINNLITLHQRKCEMMKNIKKTLLDKMFA